MECLFSRSAGPLYLGAIGRIVSEFERIKDEFEAARTAIQTTAVENRNALDAMEADNASVEGMVVYAMRPSDFRSFVADIADQEFANLGLSSLSASDIFAAVVRNSAPAYEVKLSQLNLGSEISRRLEATGSSRDFLLNALKAADDGSLPRFRFRNNQPPLTELSPRKYVVGCDLSTNLVSRLVPRCAHSNVTPVTQFSDPFRILIVETFHNFGAPHWEGFEDAHRFYLADPWWRHVLPARLVDQLPPFKEPV
jgi:hypothetical protein